MDTTLLFYWLLALTLIWMVINHVYFASIARNKSPLWVSIYRWISLTIILSVLLFFVDYSQVTLHFLFISLIFWFIWALGLVIQLRAYKYLPIWVIWALMNLYNIGIIILSYLFYNETLSLYWYIWATIILFSLIVLWSVKSIDKNLDPNYKKWLFLVFLRILTFTTWVFGFVYFSREIDPYISIWIAEFTVLIWLLPLIPFFIKKEEVFYKMNHKETYRFFLMCIFPAIMSFGLFYTSTVWNPWIVTLTLSTASIFIALVGWLFYKEKLTQLQWAMIVLSVVGLIMINL